MTASEEIKYTQDHEWVRRLGADTVRVGITDYAQQQLGDVVYVQVPEVDERVDVGGSMGEVESTKSVSDLYAPVTGTVVARNEALEDRPELVNSQPLEQGWIVDLRLEDAAEWEALLDGDAYQRLLDQA